MSALTGEREERAAFAERTKLAGNGPNRFVMGSTGRWALQWALRWPHAKPLVLRTPEGRLRDIDLFSPKLDAMHLMGLSGEPHIDTIMNLFINGDPPEIAGTNHKVVFRDRRFFPQVVRKIEGTEVTTLPLGSHFLIEQLLSPAGTISSAYREPALAAMRQFTAWARPRYPNEFLDNAAYEPYLEYARSIGRDLTALFVTK